MYELSPMPPPTPARWSMPAPGPAMSKLEGGRDAMPADGPAPKAKPDSSAREPARPLLCPASAPPPRLLGVVVPSALDAPASMSPSEEPGLSRWVIPARAAIESGPAASCSLPVSPPLPPAAPPPTPPPPPPRLDDAAVPLFLSFRVAWGRFEASKNVSDSKGKTKDANQRHPSLFLRAGEVRLHLDYSPARLPSPPSFSSRSRVRRSCTAARSLSRTAFLALLASSSTFWRSCS
ncbi:hypothetical protein FA10DRAFT_20918 [Acaromyces ingoldii]|uniref:Uncharacterized protein n=1 Tax=Acaromyces ingoldii TaxID=215250 RepID=A0A316YWI1_9BASI|nr:hypothetical protein FA10DRAFT_20918 [Acaromyces ingoldii]PWN93406.1 hypothetical protein FA10DRAFT_20918 [Acaromyces ingoldii]